MDSKKIVLFILFPLFFLAAVAVGYFYIKLNGVPASLTQLIPGKVSQKVEITQNISSSGNPIVKSPFADKSGVIYEMEGKFVKPPIKTDYGPLLKGEFVLKGDQKERTILAFVGAGDGNTFLGTYDKSFNGSSVWKAVPTDSLLNMIKPDEIIRLKSTLKSSGSAGDIDYFNQVQEVLDTLSKEIQSGNYVYKIPSSFQITAEGVEIIR